MRIRRSIVGLVVGAAAGAGCALDFDLNLDCLLGCATRGDRLQDGCPSGETCSPLVAGLWFAGPFFGDDTLFGDTPVRTTAVGGTQAIALTIGNGGGALSFSYAAEATGALQAVSISDNHVTVIANSVGRGVLSIRDRDGLLLDRTSLAVAEIDHVALAPGGISRGDWARRDEARAWVAHTGASIATTVQLFAADGTRLADTSMTIATPGVSQRAWDAATILIGDGTAPIAVDVTSGGVTRSIDLPVVDHVDAIEAVNADLDASGVADVDFDSSVCFRGVSGAAYVVGGDFTISTVTDQNVRVSDNCVVTGDARGTFDITVTLDGVTRTFTVHPVER